MSRHNRTHREKTQPLKGFWLEGFREKRVAEAAFCTTSRKSVCQALIDIEWRVFSQARNQGGTADNFAPIFIGAFFIFVGCKYI